MGPVEFASEKQEPSARTFRPKVLRFQHLFLDKLPPTKPAIPSTALRVDKLNLDDEDSVLGSLRIDSGIKPVSMFYGGTHAAKAMLSRFIRSRLEGYAENRNQPGMEYVSHMSPYLHFGQISPAYVVRKIYSSRKRTPKIATAILMS